MKRVQKLETESAMDSNEESDSDDAEWSVNSQQSDHSCGMKCSGSPAAFEENNNYDEDHPVNLACKATEAGTEQLRLTTATKCVICGNHFRNSEKFRDHLTSSSPCSRNPLSLLALRLNSLTSLKRSINTNYSSSFRSSVSSPVSNDSVSNDSASVSPAKKDKLPNPTNNHDIGIRNLPLVLGHDSNNFALPSSFRL